MARRRHAITAALAVAALTLAACGDEEGSRENVERSNLGETAEGPATVETGPTTLGSTGETQPTVDQVPTTP